MFCLTATRRHLYVFLELVYVLIVKSNHFSNKFQQYGLSMNVLLYDPNYPIKYFENMTEIAVAKWSTVKGGSIVEHFDMFKHP